MKKFILALVIVFISGFLSFSISKADWINKGKYFEMDSTYGEIVDYQISNENKIYLLNNQNELLVIDFITGKLETRNNLNIKNNYICKKISSDAKTTIFAKFNAEFLKSLNYNKIIIDCYIIDNNTLQVVYDDTISVSRSVSGGFFEIAEIINLDYNLKEKNLLINSKFDALDQQNGNASFILFGIFDVINLSTKTLLLSYSNLVDGNNIDINKLDNFYILSNSFRNYKEEYHGGSFSSSICNYLDFYNKDSNIFINIFKNDYYSSSGYIGNENKGVYYNTKCFSHNPITNNFSILTQVENNFKILSFEPIAKKYFDTLSFKENMFIKTVFDEKGLLHTYVDSIYKITSITNKLNTLDSLVFPFIVSAVKIHKNEETSFVILSSKTTNKLYYFTSENLKTIPNTGFGANLTTTLKNKKIKFYSSASPINLEFEWEVEPGVIIKTKTNYLEYSYQNIGIYNVKLKIIDQLGKEYYFEKLNYITIKEELIADFDYSFDKITRNCFFTSKSIGLINKYSWDFGDNTKSNEINPVHYYANDGNYLVQLIITNGIDNDTLDTYIDIKDNSYLLDSKNLLKKYSIVNSIKPEQYFITNDILKIFSYKNSSYYYPKDTWTKEHYRVYYSYYNYNLNLNSFELLNKDYIYHYQIYDYFDTFYPSKILNVNDSNLLFKSNYLNKPKPNLYYQNKYLEVKHLGYNSLPLNYNIIKESQLLLESDFKSLNEYHIYQSINSELRISKFNSYDTLGSSTIYLTQKIKQIKIANMNDSLLVVYSDSSYIYNAKLILENQNINLFSNISLDSNFVFTHTKLINDNIILFGKFIKVNSTIAKVYIYNLQTKELKEFNLPIFKNIEDITVFNQNLIIAGETINMSGYVLFDKDFTNYKLIYNKEYLGQVKKLNIKNNIVTLVCERIYNNKYDINILQDTLSENTSVENEIVINRDFLIFPNPSSEKISVDLGYSAVADLGIYDILGNEILSIPNYTNKSEIDISTIPIGTYTIQIQTSKGSVSQRLLVNR